MSLMLLAALVCSMSLQSISPVEVDSLQPQVAPTEVVVIGTVHSPTEYYTEDVLIDIFARVQPDVILLELERSFFTDSLMLKPQMQDLSLETRAIVRYQRETGVPIRPYDIEGRNAFYETNGYFRMEQETGRAVSNLYEHNQLSTEARYLFESLLNFSHLRDNFLYDRPEVINSRACDVAIERKQSFLFKGLRRIAKITPMLGPYRDYTVAADEFWTKRNEAMVQNILGYIREYPGKRIAVVCGFEHRYYLLASLQRDYPGLKYQLREYWSYTPAAAQYEAHTP